MKVIRRYTSAARTLAVTAHLLALAVACRSTTTMNSGLSSISGVNDCSPIATEERLSGIQSICSGATLTLTALHDEGGVSKPLPQYSIELERTEDAGGKTYARCHAGEKCPSDDGSMAELKDGILCATIRGGEDTGPLSCRSFCVKATRGRCSD